ncbi:23S rRNA (adenine(1618)-N(6))-methyltransferase RlmF [Hymenobacter busanensis]|uniref:Ribosomal RNA large subunit methyltransferase F n=1 Tax=Hymenobacter busanensis TaxID=2607656 RepID=A0A7L4ZX31_9BACT|nr:23S rRNA (adenine(1618)-N(6))-methyltransferase RlmF [Hymenobacter busanensis]KAA9333259.1 23S rRNA (adenine(1618)-N(6))-methyltransferase RlmF [Hymenobacter busanensis]QHJ08064.1 23S rRNA (adenine(1618)-N(6))-methyltransferase RlmF [Hymenobacter busanensis]
MTPAPASPASSSAADKEGLHPRNRHRGRYDFTQLVASVPELAAFVAPTAHGDESIDFADPAAVKTLNRALLKQFYGIDNWDVPAGYLTPPIPGRADYIHYLADLLAESNGGVIPRGRGIRVLDVGVGANTIFPIVGHREYGWRFVGTDTDPVAVRMAKQIVASNRALTGAVDVRLQPVAADIFSGVVKPAEVFDLTLCNPPFHASAAEAEAGNRRKNQNLGHGPAGAPGAKPALNFGGQPHELWTPGGEATFLWRMAEESAIIRHNCYWFTTLVSKKETLPGLYKSLKKLQATDVRTISMAQGHKVSRLVAWTFLDEAAQQAWRAKRWSGAERPA